MAASLSSKLNKLLFEYKFTTRLHDIDAAGVLFFARNLYYAHDAYEAFLNTQNQSIATILNSDFILPLNHAEADFKAPVFLNEIITIEIYCAAIGEDEFSLQYQFINHLKKITTTVLTRHVSLDKNSHQRIPLPESIHLLLASSKH